MLNTLWVDKYRPKSFKDIVGQHRVRVQLENLVKSKNLPNLFLSGPSGTGKSSTAEVIARELYRESWDGNFIKLNASDVFEGGKKYLATTEPFSHFHDESKGLLDNFKHSINRIAGISPLGAEFRILFINDADALMVDAQQALRRIIERYNHTCKFVFATRRPSKVIVPIRSRCLNIPFRRLESNVVFDYLKKISGLEGFQASDELASAVTHLSEGDLRKALTIFQLVQKNENEANDLTAVYELSKIIREPVIQSLLELPLNNEPLEAIKMLDKLLVNNGFNGQEIVEQLRRSARSSGLNHDLVAKIFQILGKVDFNLTNCLNERIQLEALIFGLTMIICRS
ncbi:MAG TPA: AAA family ATPase [Candidatus Acidoferrales bacterium]|nr:AAA family ATPase [Candidatus Acidoferrales bacterium]